MRRRKANRWRDGNTREEDKRNQQENGRRAINRRKGVREKTIEAIS
jgi:hypothetical protein